MNGGGDDEKMAAVGARRRSTVLMIFGENGVLSLLAGVIAAATAILFLFEYMARKENGKEMEQNGKKKFVKVYIFEKT